MAVKQYKQRLKRKVLNLHSDFTDSAVFSSSGRLFQRFAAEKLKAASAKALVLHFGRT